MNHENQVASNTVNLCEQFNTFFISVFNPSDVSDNQISIESKALNTLQITKQEVAKIHRNLNNSTGPDKIGNLRNIADESSKYLMLVFQTAINKSVYPSQWRMSHIIPVFKDGSKSDIGS